MNREQAIECFAKGVEVWYNNYSTSFVRKRIQGVDDKGCLMWDYSGNKKIIIPFSEIGLTEMEAREGHYKHRIVYGPDDVIRHAKEFGMVVLGDDSYRLTNEQYNTVTDIKCTILNDFYDDGSLDELPKALVRLSAMKDALNGMCHVLDLKGESMIHQIRAIQEAITNGRLVPEPKPKVGQRWSVLDDKCVIVDIGGLKAVNIDTGMFWDCDDETFTEHGILEED